MFITKDDVGRKVISERFGVCTIIQWDSNPTTELPALVGIDNKLNLPLWYSHTGKCASFEEQSAYDIAWYESNT
jgi:hypothetical protein